MTHTQSNLEAWWQVDLGGVYTINTIDVWNRTDCCGDRLKDFYVFVSDTAFTSTAVADTLNQAGVSAYYFSGIAGTTESFSVGRTGRYVRVQLTGTNYLSLAEEIWSPAQAATATSTSTRTATHTETVTRTPTRTGTPSRTPTRTATATPSWTRTSTPTLTHTRTGTATPSRTPTSTMTGTLTSTPTRTPTPTQTPTFTPTFAGGFWNLAFQQSAQQSSTLSGGVASRAVDGNTDGSWGNGSVTHTNLETYPWWEVDLGVDAAWIEQVDLWNRTDCCSDRLRRRRRIR